MAGGSTVVFQPESDLVDTRASLHRTVEAVLDKLSSGLLPTQAERQHVDCKEEAGRRGAGGVLLPGQAQNLAAATQLANEVACFANTPDGGAIVVGVDDKTGDLLGTQLDPDWLRHRIYQMIDVAPAVEERQVGGIRLLVLYVTAAREPVEDTSGRIRWRVGSNCEPVDRSEWWRHRQGQSGYDSMAASTGRTVDDVSSGAVPLARRYLGGYLGAVDPAGAEPPRGARELLSRLGVLLPGERLSQAGALVFCPADRNYLTVTVFDVEGGDVTASTPDLRGLSLLEQIAAVEARLDPLNREVVVHGSFSELPVRRLPPVAVREAILNGLVHRDWLSSEPTAVTWVDADSALQVISPGGFVGGVTADNVLVQRYTRHPALADLFRALGLVEKQGLGVDRMYREMVTLGHRPPVIVEEPGPRVRTRLTGGDPVVPVMALTGRIEPAVRRKDVRIALVVDTLLHEPFTTPSEMSRILQRGAAEAAEGIETAAECRVDGHPLLVQYKDVWMLSSTAFDIVESAERTAMTPARRLLPYRRPDDPLDVVRRWLTVHDRITSGDHATLTGLTQPGALNQLRRLEAQGYLKLGAGRGRNAHFVPGETMTRM
jgi:ATP-dependent DNA helicase RecG